MVLRPHQVEPRVEDLVEGRAPFHRVEHEPRHELQGNLDEHAERAEAEAHRWEQFGPLCLAHGDELARPRDEPRSDDLRRESAEPEAGAMRARRGGTRDGLAVDVAHVRHRQPVGREQRGQLVQARAGGERDPAGRDIRVDDARQVG